MNDLVSIIVPIYKVESYLRQCVDSILNQTYTNLEIILVDDGSPDSCGEICDEYALKDPRVKVIHKKNGGLSDARNAGLKIMTGEYLMFVDSDDWMEHHAVELLYGLMVKHEADLVIGGQKQVEDGTNRVIFTNCYGPVEEFIQPKTDAMEAMLRYGCCVWARLYRMDLFSDILFPIGTVHEDEAIMLPLLESCEKIIKVNAPIYNYRCREDSITNTAFAEKNLDWYKEGKRHVDWIMMHHPELENVAKARMYASLSCHLSEIAVAGTKYWPLADPLVKELRNYYPDMKKSFRSAGRPTYRLMLWRYFPYWVYGTIVKIFWRVRHHKVIT